MFWFSKTKSEKVQPLLMAEREPDLPFSIEINIDSSIGDVAYYDERPPYHHAWFNHREVASEYNRDFRPMNLHSNVHNWLNSNTKKPWKAMYDGKRCDIKGSYYYIAFSDIADATMFRLKMGEWGL